MDIYAQPTLQLDAGYIQTAPYDPDRGIEKLFGSTQGFSVGPNDNSVGSKYSTAFLVDKKTSSPLFSKSATELYTKAQKAREYNTDTQDKITQVISKTWWMQSKSRQKTENNASSNTAKSRFQLLAAKYSKDDISKELIARLDILNARIQAESPRVSLKQVEQLTINTEKLEAVRSVRERLAARLAKA